MGAKGSLGTQKKNSSSGAPTKETAPCGPACMVSTANRSHSHDPDNDKPGEKKSKVMK